MSVLKVSNLSKTFGGVKAISSVNMEVMDGEIVGLIGPNGAGKTTFFNMLTGIYKGDEGEIIYNFKNETSIKNMKPYEISAAGVSRTFQNIRLFKNMTVSENIRIGLHTKINCNLFSSLLRLPSYYKEEEKAKEKVLKLLKVFNLLDKKDELSKNLPYGEQRKLEIARALAGDPKCLFLDEPAAGMNPNETKELMELIKWIKDEFNITIILIEHDMNLVMAVCHRIYVLNYGSVIAEGIPEEIKNNKEVIKAYLGGDEKC